MKELYRSFIVLWFAGLMLCSFKTSAQEKKSSDKGNGIFAEICFIGIDNRDFPEEKNRIADKVTAEEFGKEIETWIANNNRKYLKVVKSADKHLVFSVDALKQLPKEKNIAGKEIIRMWYQALKFQEPFATAHVSSNVIVSKQENITNKEKVYFLLKRTDLEKLIQKINN